MKNKNMKIACIGNMNNNMFCLVRYLRDKGYDAYLFLVDEFDHFLPGADSYDDSYKMFLHQLDWYKIGHWKIDPKKIVEDLKGFNFIICCDRVPAYLDKAGIELDLFIPHGGDIFHLAFYNFKYFPPKKYEIGAWYQSRRQNRAIKNASNMMYDITNDVAEGYVKKIGIKGKRFFTSPPFIYYPQYYSEKFKNGDAYEAAQAFKKNHDFILMHQCRHVWKSDNHSLHYKANDVIINGYSEFLKDNPNCNSVLVMFDYGIDRFESKKLVEELGIENNVVWLELMSRKDLMRWVDICDIGIGELGRSWLSYGSVYELLALKKPFIGRRDDKLYTSFYNELYPMKSVSDSHELKIILNDYLLNKDKYKKMGEDGYDWFKKHAIEIPLESIVELIENKNI